MRSVSVREVRALLPGLEEELARTGEIVLTRRGRPIARLTPVDGAAAARPRRPNLAEFRASMPFQETPSEVLVREDRDARD
jgi:antitoxin (DNA-binding transcriptional repressor) of toxin-antitoxin stability system